MNNKIERHIVELDGFRGLAVLIVMIYHFVHVPLITANKLDILFNQVCMGGWIGVDLFFVLSGFLITGILLDKKEAPNYFSAFYYRRTLRIFPLYYFYLLFIFLVFYPLVYSRMGEVEQHKIAITQEAQTWFWLYISNIKQALDGKFFGAGTSHLWSLSIEEQYYLAWPLIVYVCSRKQLKVVSICLIAFSPLLRLVLFLLHWDPISIYIFTPTRIDALVYGSIIAAFVRSTPTINYKAYSKLVYFLIAACFILLYSFGPRAENSPVIYVFFLSLLSITTSIVVLLLQSSEKVYFRKLFLNKYLIFMGKYSYALYIFHPLIRNLMLRIFGQPKLIAGSQLVWQIAFIAACTLLSIIISQLSWHLFEKWFLHLKLRWSY